MRWFALVAALALTACGVLPGSSSSSPTPTAAQPAPASSPAAAVPSPSAAASPSPATAAGPTSTPQAATSSNTVYVGNTDGEGVFVRNTPTMDDKATAYPDGTALTIIGPDVQGDGQNWKHIRTPDGLEGYVPSMYTTDAPP